MVVLCSASPRRKELLSSLGIEFDIQPADISEESWRDEPPIQYLQRITKEKVSAVVSAQNSISGKMFIGSDTIVVSEGRILQKPMDEKNAVSMLMSLMGKVHNVHTGIVIQTEMDRIWDYDTSQIQFKNWGLTEIQDYIQKCKPFDKAGSYGIQDEISPVESWKGSYSNVMGLPIRKLIPHLPLILKYSN